jgi:hypothetical protein
MSRLLSAAALLLAFAGAATAQSDAKSTGLKHLYGQDVRVRPFGEKDFKKAVRVGVEFFHDASAGCLVAVSEAGNIAAVPFTALGETKKLEWIAAHDLKVREGSDENLSVAKKFGVEVYRDLASGKLLYVTETKSIALADAPGSLATDKEAILFHGLTLPVRSADKTDWSGATKYGVEAFRDGNTGGLIYTTHTGQLTATFGGPAEAPKTVSKPKSLYGLTLRVRPFAEVNFGAAGTKSLAAEVYQDPNAGGLLFVSETGAVAAVPTPDNLQKGKKTKWTHASQVLVRPGGEKDFAKAMKFGVESYVDENTGYRVYASDSGGLAVVKK